MISLPQSNPTKGMTTFVPPIPETVEKTFGGVKYEIPSITATKLKIFLDTSTTAKVCFIDCQSKKSNTGKQIKGAVHLNLQFIGQAQGLFDACVKPNKKVMDALAAAHVIIVYCSFGAERSPWTRGIVNTAMEGRADRQGGQKVLLLKDGVKDYAPVDPARVTTWRMPETGGNLIKVPGPKLKPTQVPKAGSDTQAAKDDDDDDYVFWTEP